MTWESRLECCRKFLQNRWDDGRKEIKAHFWSPENFTCRALSLQACSSVSYKLTRKQKHKELSGCERLPKIRAKEFFSNPLKIRNAPVSDIVLGSTVQTHLNSFTPVLKHWCFVGVNKHRWIWVWLAVVSASPLYSHSSPSSTLLFVVFLLSQPFTS